MIVAIHSLLDLRQRYLVGKKKSVISLSTLFEKGKKTFSYLINLPRDREAC